MSIVTPVLKRDIWIRLARMEQETETQKNKSKSLETAYSENREGRGSSQLDEDVHSRRKLQAERSEEVYGSTS